MLEVVLAGFLFATVISSLVGVWITYARATAAGRTMLVANHLAQNLMEQQLALGWAAQPLDPSEDRRFSLVQVVGGAETSVDYFYSVAVEDTSEPDNPTALSLKRITVTVEWDVNGQRKSLSCESMVYWGG
ncbi:MAG: hypothetical protein KC910_36815 [Candidatus Eremiobacteraeota bacterium]|nr:hypothetical protein [Candidatus Eremiobacteraeota bacterium]